MVLMINACVSPDSYVKAIAPTVTIVLGFPGGASDKEPGLPMQKTQSPGSGRSPRGGLGRPLQYSCLENPMDRGSWRSTVHGVTKKLNTTEAT